MKKEPLKKVSGRYAAEDEHFWQQHRSSFLAAGISRTVYCQQHNVNYDRFAYWLKKISTHQKTVECPEKLLSKNTALLPLKIKDSAPLPASVSPALCTLNMSNGHALVIHDERALSLLLERWRS